MGTHPDKAGSQRSSGVATVRNARSFRFAPAALILLGTVFLCGCSVIIPEPGDTYVDGRLQITYWEKWPGFEGEAIQRVVDRFNERQDRIYVNLVTLSQIDRKTLVAIAGGDPPDLVGLWSAGLSQFAETRAQLPRGRAFYARGYDMLLLSPSFSTRFAAEAVSPSTRLRSFRTARENCRTVRAIVPTHRPGSPGKRGFK